MKRIVIGTAKRLLPHIVIILSVVFLVLVILNAYNPTMGFLSNQMSTYLLIIFCILAFAESLLFIFRNRIGK